MDVGIDVFSFIWTFSVLSETESSSHDLEQLKVLEKCHSELRLCTLQRNHLNKIEQN